MTKKIVYLSSVGNVELTKKRGLRSIRLRVDPHGLIKVSVPWLVPQQIALDFVHSKQEWIKKQALGVVPLTLKSSMPFGKGLTLFVAECAPRQRSRLTGTKLHVYVVGRLQDSDPEQTLFIKKAMIRALKHEAQQYLLPRVAQQAARHGISYRDSSIKKLTGRWGSCDRHGSIILSLFLVQLPWQLIDYVIAHELAHTKHLNHSPEFWAEVSRMSPEYKAAKKLLRSWQPRLYEAGT